MRIEVLGPIRLSTDEGVAERHLRLLLASLVAAGGEPVSVDVLVDRLWGEDPPASWPIYSASIGRPSWSEASHPCSVSRGSIPSVRGEGSAKDSERLRSTQRRLAALVGQNRATLPPG